MTKIQAFEFILATKSQTNAASKTCLAISLRHDTGDPNSDLALTVKNNAQLIICPNYYTFLTIAANLGSAVLKEEVEVSYYQDFAKAAISKVEAYIQLGMVYAVRHHRNRCRRTFTSKRSRSTRTSS